MLPTIKKHSKGDAVKIAQILSGYSGESGEFDIYFDSYIRSFQLNHNLIADGVVGEQTWRAIAAEAPIVSIKTLRQGKYAMAVQMLVGVDADGIFGNKTKAAVVAFQTAAGLKADGVVGKNTWTALICGSEVTPTGKILNPCVFYLQWDKRWKSIMYSNHNDKGQTIGSSGCGPSSMAMILATWIDSTITPVQACELALQGGYRTYDQGTGWGYFAYIAGKYPEFTKFVKTSNLATVLAAIKAGALVVCSMNGNDGNFWTKRGHFITALGCDDTYVYANDPNKSSHPRKQKQSKFKSCMKQAFIFYK